MKKIDFHVHILDQIPLEDTEKNFKDVCARKNYEGICIQALYHAGPITDPLCNEKALELIRRIPNSYAFASLKYDEDFVEQTKKYIAQGFSGIKLLNGKPTEYRYSGLGLEHERFEPFFELCEKELFSVVKLLRRLKHIRKLSVREFRLILKYRLRIVADGRTRTVYRL